MHERILVEVYVPAMGNTYDIFFPLAGNMYDVVNLVARALTALSDGQFQANESTVLCDAVSGAIFNRNASVQELQLENGSRLMLI